MLEQSDRATLKYVLDEVILPSRYKKISDTPKKKRKKNPKEKVTQKELF